MLWLYLVNPILSQTCGEFVDSNGIKYNIGPLKNTAKDYNATYSNTEYNYDYFINICTPVLTTNCGSNVGGCQVYTSKKDGKSTSVNIGSSSLVLQDGKSKGVDGYGVTASFTGGSGGRSFEIDFPCEPNAGAGTPSFSGEAPSLHYNFQWPSIYGCPVNYAPPSPGPSPSEGGSSGLSGGSILLIILLVLVVVYIVGGILFNRFYRHESGVGLIPNLEFWSTLPGLVKDGVMFIVNKARGTSGSYQQV